MPPIFAHFATGFEDYEINRQCVEEERERGVNIIGQKQEVVVLLEGSRASHDTLDDTRGVTGLHLLNNTFLFTCTIMTLTPMYSFSIFYIKLNIIKLHIRKTIIFFKCILFL
uniref:Uncharacterized protein n=1 Tax=Heterorhabditis bacteriophora TaxID=37862 RepID=A0A1I7W641_HETBA